jgi:hypothetical protein
MSRIRWWIFTKYGAYSQEGATAKLALNRFQRMHRNWEVMGIFRDDLIIKPPGTGGPPFVCMFNRGQLESEPNPELEDQMAGRKR